MPYFNTAQEWLTKSTQLLEARPTTTRITTKYTIPRSSKNHPKDENPLIVNSASSTTPSTTTATVNTTETARVTTATTTATLTIKTYDPVSGVTLKYKTDKAAEVGRLVQIMGRLGRGMAGLEMKDEMLASVDAEKKNFSGAQNVKKGRKKGRK